MTQMNMTKYAMSITATNTPPISTTLRMARDSGDGLLYPLYLSLTKAKAKIIRTVLIFDNH